MKKILVIFSLLLLFSCTAIERANDFSKYGRYNEGLSVLQNEIQEANASVEIIMTYEKIFNNGQAYYSDNFEEEELFNLESKYLSLNKNTKNKLKNISVDIQKHKNLGEKISENILQEIEFMPEDSYEHKIKKYNSYEKILKYSSSKNNYVKENKQRLRKKIEQTYKVTYNGDYSIINNFKIYQNRLSTKGFRYSNNADADLIIDIEYDFEEPETTTVSDMKTKTWKVKDNYGKDVTNRETYEEVTNIRTAGISIRVDYKLVSNLTGEKIFYGQDYFNRNFEEKWRTYNLISFSGLGKSTVLRNEKEKKVPTEKEILEEIIPKIYNKINEEFSKIQYIKN